MGPTRRSRAACALLPPAALLVAVPWLPASCSPPAPPPASIEVARGLSGPRPRPRPFDPALQGLLQLIGQGRLAEARKQASVLEQSQPGDPQIAFLIGLTYFKSDNHGAAKPWFERALEREAGFFVVHDYLGQSLFHLGDLAGARREYQAFLAVDPREPKFYTYLAMVELEQSNLEAAQRRLDEAAELFALLKKQDPRMHQARQADRAEVHARRADLHFFRDEYPEARDELLESLKLNPRAISAHYTLGQVYRRLDEDEKAEASAQRYERERERVQQGQRR